VSLKGQASESVLVLAPELHRLAAMAPLALATLPEMVPAVVPAQVQATMVVSAAVEALERDPVAVDILKIHFPNKLELEPNTHF